MIMMEYGENSDESEDSADSTFFEVLANTHDIEKRQMSLDEKEYKSRITFVPTEILKLQ